MDKIKYLEAQLTKKNKEIDKLRDAVIYYVTICGNTCHSVTRETAIEMYDTAIKALGDKNENRKNN